MRAVPLPEANATRIVLTRKGWEGMTFIISSAPAGIGIVCPFALTPFA